MRFVFGAIATALLSGVGATPCGAKEIPEADLRFFENRIRPILVEHCYECHSEEAGKRKGGLWLDRRAGWEDGGDSGPSAIVHDVEGSLLIKTVRYTDPDLEMPPEGKLSPQDISDLETWVAKGLPDPRDKMMDESGEGFDLEKRKQYWSYQPRKKAFGDRDSIDDFINFRLASEGFEPLPAASPEALLRRAKIDLTGLIPKPEEIESYTANPDHESYEHFVDAWLGTHAFGERWGRHWLDIVRYADSSGGGRALAFPNAWRLRDYVIDSFADDRPLDELIRAHVAGDLLPFEDPSERVENLIATGFLVMGPINYENQNKDELEFDIIDEQIDTLGRAFMGQTLGCARCHDHKFDPIPTSDYYAMAGIFKSTDFVTHANVSKWHTEPVPPSSDAKEVLDAHAEGEKSFQTVISELKQELALLGRGAGSRVASVPILSLPGIVVDGSDAILEGEWQESTSTPRYVGGYYLHDLHEGTIPKSVRFEFELPHSGRFEIRIAYSAAPNRNTAVPVTIEGGGIAKTVTVNQRIRPEHDRLFHTLGKWEFTKAGRISVTVRNTPNGDGHVMADAIQCLSEAGNELPSSELSEVEKTRVTQLEADLKVAEASLQKLLKSAPRIPKAMSVVDLKAEEISDTEIRIRGVEANRGPVAPRGFLQAAVWNEMDRESFEISDAQSGRLELARWITAPQNPLTARVMVNRIWLHLMGEGLVRTADNFGITGEKPTHPELLDFLAGRLIDSGWSTKALVKEIMMSDAYARCSRAGELMQAKADPENKLYWRAHLRPLDVEALRDAILTLSGELDLNGGGPSLPKKFKSEFGHQFVTLKRTVYVPAFRNSGYEMFSVFDFANPNFTVGKRADSTIPTQALFLTNSSFVHEQAEKAAARFVNGETLDIEDTIRAVFLHTLARTPTAEELELTVDFMERDPNWETNPSAAWTALQRSLFGSIDFRYLR
ncbi:DUF1553 domain-containing protein [Verrucomicrobiales bacterium]|nr:DUF1553 domain-containing protein [Verrucomicrobiales bacterium]MDA7926489.1 DUF1553 domain-containing protein [Verrucomicrobiales bacterium]